MKVRSKTTAKWWTRFQLTRHLTLYLFSCCHWTLYSTDGSPDIRHCMVATWPRMTRVSTGGWTIWVRTANQKKKEIHFQSFDANFQLFIHFPSKYINMHVITLLLMRLTLSQLSSTRSGEEFGRKWQKFLKLTTDGVDYRNQNSSIRTRRMRMWQERTENGQIGGFLHTSGFIGADARVLSGIAGPHSGDQQGTVFQDLHPRRWDQHGRICTHNKNENFNSVKKKCKWGEAQNGWVPLPSNGSSTGGTHQLPADSTQRCEKYFKRQQLFKRIKFVYKSHQGDSETIKSPRWDLSSISRFKTRLMATMAQSRRKDDHFRCGYRWKSKLCWAWARLRPCSGRSRRGHRGRSGSPAAIPSPAPKLQIVNFSFI